jgi:NADH-quinone oxidoreductase subunit N
MMGLAPLTRDGGAAVLFYLVAYLVMNLGAFAVVAFIRNATGSEDLHDLRGLIRRAPWLVVTLSLFLLSLLGIPPLIGFVAKYQIFAALYDASLIYDRAGFGGLGAICFGLLIIAGLNTVLSAVYYLNVLKVMILESRAEDLEGKEPVPYPVPAGAIAFTGLLSAAVVGLIMATDPLTKASDAGVKRFNATSARVQQSTQVAEAGQ